MATWNFYLKKENKKKLCPVMFCYQNRGQKFRFFTRVNVAKTNWLNNQVKAVSLQDYEDNEKISDCEKAIKEIEREVLVKELQLSVKEVELKFRTIILRNKKLCPKEKNSNSNSEFFTLFDAFVEQAKTTKA